MHNMLVNFGENFLWSGESSQKSTFGKNISLAEVTFQHEFMVTSVSNILPFLFTNRSLLLKLPEHKTVVCMYFYPMSCSFLREVPHRKLG